MNADLKLEDIDEETLNSGAEGCVMFDADDIVVLAMRVCQRRHVANSSPWLINYRAN